MPTLQWIGKEKVVSHHLDVPFRVLDQQYTFGSDDGNMISGATTFTPSRRCCRSTRAG